MIARIFLVLALAVVVAACSGDEERPPPPPSESATPAESPTPSPTSAASPRRAATPQNAESLDHDIDNAMGHVQVLSVAIGPRVSGSRASRETVSYIADTFRESGYAVEVMEFDYPTRFRPATVTVGGRTIDAFALNGEPSPAQSAEGPAHGSDSPEGAVSVVARDERNPNEGLQYLTAARAGAAALVVVNRPQWPMWGNLIPARDAFPVVLVPHTEEDRFAQAVEEGSSITVTIGQARPTAANVIARPTDGARCDILAGGHHDTVSGAAGAIDNASGVAVVLELARAFAADGLDEGLCFATFGAEESGLFGSAALARRWRISGDLPAIMVNFDVTARGDAVEVIGTSALVEEAVALLDQRGIPAYASSLPPGHGSDHTSFSRLGVPVLFFSDGDVSLIHTSRDTFDRVEPVALDRIGDAAALVVSSLLAEIAGAP